MLVPCWFTVFVFWPGHSTTKCQACFWMFLFCFEVVNQRENYKRTTFYCEMLSSRMGCSRLLTLCSRFAHACSRFAHGLLTLCSRSPRFLLSPLGSFWVLTRFLLSPYEGLLTVLTVLTVCSRLLTVCSRCSRFAQALGIFGEVFETHMQRMPHFFRAIAFSVQAIWGWISNRIKRVGAPHATHNFTHNPSLKRGCHTPASAWDLRYCFIGSKSAWLQSNGAFEAWHNVGWVDAMGFEITKFPVRSSLKRRKLEYT